ncbi:hypothetical protein [Helicobacter cappadocius]|uniref:Uncharacterized protein n=1 Tax=Helicobacter cappadocius TaxID=3063998 RepID=A0AA90TEZ0_9HELI|nr:MULTISPECIES: hypothetical protein [unclassified Helicobacter]MDO7253196.1 hypothetical protein [Helicobacter sp. faydin-H75]MDP2539120.1 hypothetical protein [Helicobacter sp. faydin-H76]
MNNKIFILLLVTFFISVEDGFGSQTNENNLYCTLSNDQAKGCIKPIKTDKSAVSILLSHQKDIFNAHLSVGIKKSNYNYLMSPNIFGEDFLNKDIDLGHGLKLLNGSDNDHYYEYFIKGDYLLDEAKRTALQGKSVEVKVSFDFANAFHKMHTFFRRLFL